MKNRNSGLPAKKQQVTSKECVSSYGEVFTSEREVNSIMNDIKFPLITLSGNRFQISVDLNLYVKEAITATCYKLSHLYFIHQSIDPTTSHVNVIFEAKENQQISDDAPKLFCNELINEQVRHDVNVKFGHIRNMIVEEAFKPLNK